MRVKLRLPNPASHTPFRNRFPIVNVSQLAQLGQATVSPESLLERGTIRNLYDGLKILGKGELSAPVSVSAHAFSRSAKEKILKAGGKAEVIAAG